MLDLAQNLIQKSTQPAIYGLCYYLAIESLNKSPNNFIQYKAIEILLHLKNINNESFFLSTFIFLKESSRAPAKILVANTLFLKRNWNLSFKESNNVFLRLL